MSSQRLAGARLRAWRDRARKTQQDVADVLGVDKSFVAHMEAGRHRPSGVVAFALQRLTGISAEVWFKAA